ncbi:hypothetical protein NVIE_029060 [Nitrososphaera viennensis EN76]|uniref:Uncharacterized protein n=1 Tax=Nitrososphaera viennensis EN76 TaxID=926571 RepID=A0A060HVV9_9ARCH|nr:hypothetical protein NVIE_029060 [Nitrososphaera viennensis EN76]
MVKMHHIVVEPKNYFWLKSKGQAGDSFNDVITHLRRKLEGNKQFGKKKSRSVPSSGRAGSDSSQPTAEQRAEL